MFHYILKACFEKENSVKNHYTIKKNGKYEIDIKKSHFICHLKRTSSENEAQDFIRTIKKEHHKATHNCSAYLIGEHDEIQRAHDDGEPSGTAGLPMLEILKKRNLKNITAVVTRYFGGIKLGAGGLIRAYSGSVNQAIDKIGVVEKQLLQEIQLTIDYATSGRLENELKESNYILKKVDYTDKVTFNVYVQQAQVDQFYEDTREWLSGQGVYQEGKQAWLEVEVTSLSDSKTN